MSKKKYTGTPRNKKLGTWVNKEVGIRFHREIGLACVVGKDNTFCGLMFADSIVDLHKKIMKRGYKPYGNYIYKVAKEKYNKIQGNDKKQKP